MPEDPPQKLKTEFEDTIRQLKDARARNSRKAEPVIAWIHSNFNLTARVSDASNANAIHNRLIECLMPADAPGQIAIFLCNEVDAERLKEDALNMQYIRPQTIVVMSNQQPYKCHSIIEFKKNEFSDWFEQEYNVDPSKITSFGKSIGRNLIVYGAPGTGKSRWVRRKYETSDFMRVVFHHEYSYFDFVGSYKPVPMYKVEEDAKFKDASGIERTTHGEPYIDYQFVPGPFIQMLMKAVEDPAHHHTLIIEEINRADAANVFGDIFQTLDRDDFGRSEYPVAVSEELKAFFLKSEVPELKNMAKDGLRIPSNMSIVATMNSADQGVRPLDSAFKRRWDFHYMPLEPLKAKHHDEKIKYAGRDVPWGAFVYALNKRLMSDEISIDEDRLIGPYFIKPGSVANEDSVKKIILYLKDDLLRYKKDFFAPPTASLNELISLFPGEDVLNITSEGLKEAIDAYAKANEDRENPEDAGGNSAYWDAFIGYAKINMDFTGQFGELTSSSKNYISIVDYGIPNTGVNVRMCKSSRTLKANLYVRDWNLLPPQLTAKAEKISKELEDAFPNENVTCDFQIDKSSPIVIEKQFENEDALNSSAAFDWLIRASMQLHNVLKDYLPQKGN